MGKKSHNLTYCSSLQVLVVYNFSETGKTFSVSFGDYVTDCWWLHDMVSIYLIRKGEYDWFLQEYVGLLLDWLIFLLCLLEFLCCTKYSAKATNFSILNPFLHFLHLFFLKYFRIFVPVPNAIYLLLSSKVFHEGSLEDNFINFVAFFLHGVVWWRLIVSK